jgi:5-methylcytosine-specific restriction endonuclease McrA
MRVIFKKKSLVHGVYPCTPHIKSYAALVLLNDYLQKEEIEDCIRNDTYTYQQGEKPNWKVQVAFNTRFLRKQETILGSLTCVYCGKGNLVIDSLNKITLATADHVIPKSKGGHPFDERNLVVACSKCNGAKGDKEGYRIDGEYRY